MRVFNSNLATVVAVGGIHEIYVPTETMKHTTSTVVEDNCEDGFINVTAKFLANVASIEDVRAIQEYIYNPIQTKLGDIKRDLPGHIKDIGNGMFEIGDK